MLTEGNSTLKTTLPVNASSDIDKLINRDPAASLEFKGIKIFFYFFILICSTTGNFMATFVICTSRKMRTPSYALILNLSICDLVTPLVSIPFDFAMEENNYIWIYGSFMCKFLWPCSTFSSTSAALTLAAISLDRYRLIMHPFKTKLSSKHIKLIIFAIHLVSLLFVLPYVNALKLQDEYCNESWPKGFPYRKAYTIALFLIQYSVPLVFMVVMYAMAVKNLRLSTHKMRKNSIRSYSEQRKISRSESDTSKKTKILKAAKSFWTTPNAKATKMFIVVVAVFAIFMFPNQILWMWLDLGQNASHPYLNLIKVVCWLFTYTNSVVNPFIYCLYCKDFRNGFKRLFLSLVCCKKFQRERKYTLSWNSHTVNDSFYSASFKRRRTNTNSTNDSRDLRQIPANTAICTRPKVSFDMTSFLAKPSFKEATYSERLTNEATFLSSVTVQREEIEGSESLSTSWYNKQEYNKDRERSPYPRKPRRKNNSFSSLIPTIDANNLPWRETDC